MSRVAVFIDNDMIVRIVLGRYDSTIRNSTPAIDFSADKTGNKLTNKIRYKLERYFKGNLKKIDLPFKKPASTLFRERIWEELLNIEYGELISYRGLSARAGYSNAYRAVGNALAANPLPLLIPCHRVIRTDGNLGGFSAGTRWKEFLVSLENGGIYK